MAPVSKINLGKGNSVYLVNSYFTKLKWEGRTLSPSCMVSNTHEMTSRMRRNHQAQNDYMKKGRSLDIIVLSILSYNTQRGNI